MNYDNEFFVSPKAGNDKLSINTYGGLDERTKFGIIFSVILLIIIIIGIFSFIISVPEYRKKLNIFNL
jgi:hypothetical protein